MPGRNSKIDRSFIFPAVMLLFFIFLFFFIPSVSAVTNQELGCQYDNCVEYGTFYANNTYIYNWSKFHYWDEGYPDDITDCFDASHYIQVCHSNDASCDYACIDAQGSNYYTLPPTWAEVSVMTVGDTMVIQSGSYSEWYGTSATIKLLECTSPNCATYNIVAITNLTQSSSCSTACYFTPDDLPEREEAGGTSYNYTGLTGGLVLYLDMDECAGNTGWVNDSSGNSNDFYNTGADNTTGKIGCAYDFEEDNTDFMFLEIEDSTYLDVGTQNFTISAWVKLETAGNDAAIFSNTNADTDGWRMAQQGNSLFQFLMRDGGVGPADPSNSTLSSGVWYHVVVKREHKTGSIYVNGQLEGIETYSTSVVDVDTNEDFVLGALRASATGANLFDGVIDELGVWNRSLNHTEILELYNSGDGFSPFSETSSSTNLTILTSNMSDVNMGFNETDSSYLHPDYFNSSNVYCYLEYMDPSNYANVTLYAGYNFFGSNIFDAGLYSNCSLYLGSYWKNITTALTWGTCTDYTYSNCEETTFDLIISGTEEGPIPEERSQFGCAFIDNCYFDTDVYLYGSAFMDVNDYYDYYDAVNFSFMNLETYENYSVYSEIGGDYAEENTSTLFLILNPEDAPLSMDVYFEYFGDSGDEYLVNLTLINDFGSIYQEFYYVEDAPAPTCTFTLSQTTDGYDFEYDESLNFPFYLYGTAVDYLNISVQYNGSTTDFSNIGGSTTQNFTDFYVSLNSGNYMEIFAYSTNVTLANFSILFINETGCEAWNNFSINISSTGGSSSSSGNLGGIAGLFPEVNDESTGHWLAIVIILLFLVGSIIFIGIPLKFNKFAIILIFLITMFGVFLTAIAGYCEWSWFIVPPVLVIVYFIITKILGGGD